jgi:hypothetical protein
MSQINKVRVYCYAKIHFLSVLTFCFTIRFTTGGTSTVFASCAPVVLTFNCLNRHRHTHCRWNSTDIQSCASVLPMNGPEIIIII